MNAPSIFVPRDFEGIRQAAIELFEDSLVQREANRALDRAEGSSNRQRLEESFKSRLTLAAGYYSWVEYLMDLDGILAAGIQLPIEKLLDTEIHGLRMLRLARGEFSRRHPACGACGELNDRFAQQCSSCGVKFQRAKAA